MKRYHLIPALLITLVAVNSCLLKDVFTMENVEEIVTVYGSELINDVGTNYTVTQSQISDQSWKVEGARYYAVFDILNRSLEINLKKLFKMEIVTPEAKAELDPLPQDPVLLSGATVSGGYVNLVFETYKDKQGNYASHAIWQQEMENGSLKLYLYFDGNNENPVYLEDSRLEMESHFVSIPLDRNITYSGISLTTYILQQDSEGKAKVIPYTYPFRG